MSKKTKSSFLSIYIFLFVSFYAQLFSSSAWSDEDNKDFYKTHDIDIFGSGIDLQTRLEETLTLMDKENLSDEERNSINRVSKMIALEKAGSYYFQAEKFDNNGESQKARKFRDKAKKLESIYLTLERLEIEDWNLRLGQVRLKSSINCLEDKIEQKIKEIDSLKNERCKRIRAKGYYNMLETFRCPLEPEDFWSTENPYRTSVWQ